MTDTLKDTFWDRLDDITAGMLSTPSAPPRPMAHSAKRKDNMLWFITATGTDIAEAAKGGAKAQYTLASGQGQLYAAVEGTLSEVNDPDKLDEIWSPMAAAWFEEGRKDDDIVLVGFKPTRAEVWETDGKAKTLFEMARANMGHDTPDVGKHGHLTF